MATETFLEWVNKQAEWARDAIRRHAASAGYSLSEADKAAVVERVRHAAGYVADPAPVCEPFLPNQLGDAEAVGPPNLLASIGPVRNLNRLAADQTLKFALDGITLIYGDNGSGKSGYCRIAKKLCRSLSTDDLLGNVFDAAVQEPPEIEVGYRLPGEDKTTTVTWNTKDAPPKQLAQLSVFDSHNARLYVDRENRIAYMPAAISLLEQHGAHRTEMDKAFKAEIQNIERRIKVALPAGYNTGTAVSKLLAPLYARKGAPPTTAELQSGAEWTTAHAEDLQKLEQSLAQDPAVLAKRCERTKVALDGITAEIKSIEAALSDDACATLQELTGNARSTAAAAMLAATEGFAAEPLPKVGQAAWRLMYDYAKAYAGAAGLEGERLPQQEGEPCVLCQDPLSTSAADRIRRFNDFVAGTATQAADAAAAKHVAATKALNELVISSKAKADVALGEFASMTAARKKVADAVASYVGQAGVRRGAMVAAATTGEFGALPKLPESVLTAVSEEITRLDQESAAFTKIAEQDKERAGERAKLNELRDRKKLHDELATFVDRLNDLQDLDKLKECCKAVDSRSVSLQITALRRSMVTEGLETRIIAEIKNLGLDHIPFAVSDRSDHAKSYFQVELESATEIDNNKVLSEGEQRALALACFLAEVESDDAKHGLIIDDPVSSLDYVRIRRVALRLVAEAKKGRQIVVFTHNLHFFHEVLTAAAQHQVPIAHRFFAKSADLGFGVIDEHTGPWIMQSVSDRIAALQARHKAFGAVTEFETDDWRAKAKDFYTDLRETWERLVEEVLFGKVVERFNTDVRTQSLREVSIEDSDHATVFWAMKRVSEYSGHDRPAGKVIGAPTLTDMTDDLKKIEAFRNTVVARRKATRAAREKLETAPAAKTG